MSVRRLVVLLLGIALLGACSGPSQSTDEPGPAADTDPAETDPAGAALADVETFDVSAYSAQPPEKTVEVTHQVPSRLLRGQADEGVKQTVDGYRVQVFSAQDQEAAQDFRERVRQWWEKVQDEAPEELFRSQPPIIIEYSQPYYRVRFGAFAEREEASDALEFLQEEYDGAFVVQGTVTIVR